MRSFFARAQAQPGQAEVSPAALVNLTAAMKPPKGIVAIGVLSGDAPPCIKSTGRSPERELFELGSVTKTVTATALAQLVVDGLVTLETAVGDILGPKAGRAEAITLGELATHTSGLPKLAPNAIGFPFWPRDPYRFYNRSRLWRGLAEVKRNEAAKFAYSNLGFALLGACLAAATRTPIGELLTEVVLRPAGMATARCQPCRRKGLVAAHGRWLTGGRRWHQPLPGAGGIDGSIGDLAAWTAANFRPDSTPLASAIRLAHRTHHQGGEMAIGLSWVKTDGTTWHNGGTGGFSSFVGVRGDRAVCAIASYAATPTFSLDGAAFAYLEGESTPV